MVINGSMHLKTFPSQAHLVNLIVQWAINADLWFHLEVLADTHDVAAADDLVGILAGVHVALQDLLLEELARREVERLVGPVEPVAIHLLHSRRVRVDLLNQHDVGVHVRVPGDTGRTVSSSTIMGG